MVWLEHVDDLIAQIKEALPPDHPLRNHKLFPGIKWERRPILIVDDGANSEHVLMNLEQRNARGTQLRPAPGRPAL